MMTKNSKVSVVIRCYNEEQHIGRLLNGIMHQTHRNLEIIIVDSGSTDATLQIASKYPVHILKIPKQEFSFGRSLNIGCSAATGEYIVIASAHVYPVYKDWIAKLVEPFSEPRVGLVYGKQRGNEVTKYSEHRIFAQWFPLKAERPQGHPFCNNANAAIRRTLWEIMPYNEQLTGLEDIDWAKRVMQLGHTLVYEPSAEIVHVHNESWQQICNRYRREAIALKDIFPDHHFSWIHFIALLISNSFSDYYHALHDRALFKNLIAIPLFRLMQFWGTYKGHQQKVVLTEQLRQILYYPKKRLSRAETMHLVAKQHASEKINYDQATASS